MTKQTSGLERCLQLWLTTTLIMWAKANRKMSELTLVLLLQAPHQPDYEIKQCQPNQLLNSAGGEPQKRSRLPKGNLKYGFTFTIINEELCSWWILYLEILATERMKPSQLARHWKSKHPEYKDKPLQFFPFQDVWSHELLNPVLCRTSL